MRERQLPGREEGFGARERPFPGREQRVRARAERFPPHEHAPGRQSAEL